MNEKIKSANHAGGQTRPLDGIRVITLEHALAAPLCTRHLADLGAEVIKIERHGEGDFARGYDHAVKGTSAYFVWLNRGKKSLVLDIRAEGAREVLHRLVRSSDVLVQNLAPGAASRAGLDYETLRPVNERLVVADISGYGDGGSFSNKKAYDMLIQAEAGLISINGTPETPARVGISVADLATGMYAHNAILAALLQRGRTGRGGNVKIAMIDALAEWMHYPMYRYAYSDYMVPRIAMNNPSQAPYGGHATKDGTVIFSVQNEREWRAFCEVVLRRPELTLSEKFGTNILRMANVAELTRLIEASFADKTSMQVVALLDEAGIANGRLNTAKDLWEHEQLAQRKRWREVGIPGGEHIRALLPPAIFDSFEAVMGDVPTLGQHTDEVLSFLEFDADTARQMRESGVVG